MKRLAGPVAFASALILAGLLCAATLGCDRGGGRQKVSQTVAAKRTLWAVGAPLSFARPATDPTGAEPQSVALGDLNGDGRLDLVVPNEGAGSVSVLANRGNGTFEPARRYPTGSGPSSVALGDMDGDDGLDIVTANGAASTVSVLLNEGDGTFKPKSDYRVGIDSDPNSVGLGDLDGDGKLNVVTANFADGTVTALMNAGGGKLAANVVYRTETSLVSVAVTDLNGDGKADLVLTPSFKKIFVLLNDGHGAFPEAVDYDTGDEPVIATGDLDGDGKPDLAVSSEDSTVLVLRNRGDGSFRPGGELATGSTARSETMCERCVAIGDVNGDGKPDIVTANQGADTVSVLVSRGDGRFRPRRDYRSGTAPRSIAIGDVNGDGKPDLVSAAAGNMVAVLVNTTGAPATPIRRLQPGQPRGTIVFASDRSGDFEIYSARADGSRLGRITRNRAQDTRPLFSPDGRRLAFVRGDSTSVSPYAGADLWVADADGSGERKLASYAHDPAWAPNSEQIAYTDLNGQLAITEIDGRGRVVFRGQSTRPSWSPDGRRLAVLRGMESPVSLMVVGSDSHGRTLIRSGIDYAGMHGPAWSPAGDLIAFSNDKSGLNAVTPDGRGFRHLAWHADAFAWSPDGKRIAFVAGGRLYVVRSAGRATRDVTPAIAGRLDAPAWSPDGRWIVVTSQPPEGQEHTLVVASADGLRSRSIARLVRNPYGSETLWPTWRPGGVTAQRLGSPLARRGSEVSSRSAFHTRGSIKAIAADGLSVAVVVAYRGRTCSGVAVWTPVPVRVVHLRAPCRIGEEGPGDVTEVAVAGDRVAWDESRVSMNLSTEVLSATLARRAPVMLGGGSLTDFFSGELALGLHGDSSLLAFTVEEHCEGSDEFAQPRCPPGRKPGQVSSATVWRAGDRAGLRVASAKGELTVLAVDAGRIAARTDHGVRLLTAGGRRLRDFPVEHVRAAALSGNRLALRVPGAVEVYDTGSGELAKRFTVRGRARLGRLEDLDRGILVTVMGRTVTLRSLTDGRTATIHARGSAHAQLEPSGLFVAGGHRVTFTPMANLLRRLD